MDWCSYALTGWYNKKVEFSPNVLESLWCYFDDLLHSKKLCSFLKNGKSISLRLNMAQLLLDRLQDHEQPEVAATVGLSTLLSVCQGILSAPSLSSVFTTKYELMVSLLARLISLACHHFQQVAELPKSTLQSKSEHEPYMDRSLSESFCETGQIDLQSDSTDNCVSTEHLASSKLVEVLLHTLICYSSVQRQQTNPNRVFTLVTNQLFQPMILLRHWLSSDVQLPVSQQISRDIQIKIDSILQLALFPPEHMCLYQEELTKMDSGNRSLGAAKGPLKPASVILSKLTVESICEPPLYYSVKSNTVSVLFKLFLESYGAEKESRNEEQGMLCFYFLVSLSGALDIGLDFQKIFCKNEESPKCMSLQSAPCIPESWSLALLSLETLLNNALCGNIYNVAADRIRHEEVQLRFYRALAEILLKEAQPSIPAWYRCLKALISLNHLILEPVLEQLLSLAWVNMDCLGSRVLGAKQVTMCSLLQTYTKLRQLPRFFTDLLSVISETTLDQPQGPLLSQEVAASLRTCLLDTPPSQTVEICSLVLQSFKKHIPQYNPQTFEDEMSIDSEVRFNTESSLKMLSLGQLLHSALFSLKTIDNSSPLPLIRQCQNFMKAMHETVNELQQVLAKLQLQTNASIQKTPKKAKEKVVDAQSQFQRNVLEATLLLRYTWVEMDTLFNIHCSKYSSLESFHQITENQSSLDSTILECVENILSRKSFLQSVVRSPLSSLLQRYILLQHMKKILLNPSRFVSLDSTAVLNQAAHFIVAEEEIEKCDNSSQKWDGQMNNVNESSYQVAHWHLVISNLPLILPFFGEKDVECIAKSIVGSQLNRLSQDKNASTNSLTIYLVSSQFLKSEIFPELPSLLSATVHFLLQSLTTILDAAQKPKDFDFFQNFSGIQKERFVEGILKSLTNREACVELSKTEIQDALNLLQIIEIINTNGMSSEDMSSCFLVLLFMLTSCQRKDGECSEGASYTELLQKLLQVLNCLMQGTNFPHVFKSIHAGTLLQAVVCSLLCSRVSSTEHPDWSGLIKEMQTFIKHLVQLIITRSSSVRVNLNQFASYLFSDELKVKLTEAPNSDMLLTHILLAALSTFSQTLTSNLGKGKSLDLLLTQILTQTTATLGLAVESVLKPHTVIPQSSFISQAFVVEIVTVMLQCELSSSPIEENKQTQSIRHMPLYQCSSQQILKEITSAPRPLEFLVSSTSFLAIFYSAVEKMSKNEERVILDDLFMTILHSLQRLLTATWISLSDLSELEPVLQMLLCHLVENCSSERFNLLLLMIKDGLDSVKLRAGNSREVLATVIYTKLLFCCPLPEACFNALWIIAPQILSSLMFLLNASSQDIALNLHFTVPVAAAVTTLLRQGERLIANPHHVTMVLGALQCVPLVRLTPAVYETTFTAIHEALFAIIKCHPQVMLKAAPSFLNVFYRLVASIMQEGKQRKDSDTGPDSGVYLRCAMLVERMYSHIVATSEDFTTLSAFIVAQYVTELQKVTLRPDIKLHLTEGIYMILDLCLETDIKFLMAGLQAGVREVFNDLYSSYTHYHKTQRQGEEKYTV